MRLVLVTLALLLAAPPAAALPWIDPGDVPLPSGARSVLVQRHDEPLFTRPAAQAPRRGSAGKTALLPLYGATRGAGCQGRWLNVGPVAWVCEDHVQLSAQPALAPRSGAERFADGLPYRYYFVGADGSLGYAKLRLAEEGIPDAELEPGFALAVVQEANRGPHDPFGLTTHGMWVPMRDLGPARPSGFHGAELDGKLNVAWVYTESATVHPAPGKPRLRGAARTRFERLTVLEEREHLGRRWLRIGPEQWVSSRHVRAATSTPAPEGLLPGERWLDVDIDNQVLVAYEGDRPVFGTLVSTGKGRGNSTQATPRGLHRLWVKLRTSDMDNLEDEEASRYYAIQAVPWVMYFQKGYGLHGTFWHRAFGRVRSHGCVNLTPLDALRLFYWTSPRLPAGWTAALPTPYERGTLVQVR